MDGGSDGGWVRLPEMGISLGDLEERAGIGRCLGRGSMTVVLRVKSS